MTLPYKIISALALVVLMIYFLVIPRLGQAVVIVNNNSNMRLTEVELSGDWEGAWKVRMSDIEPKYSRSIQVPLRGESGLRIDFKVNNQSFTCGDLAYLEPDFGYTATINIDEYQNISCSDSGFFSWHWRRIIPF